MDTLTQWVSRLSSPDAWVLGGLGFSVGLVLLAALRVLLPVVRRHDLRAPAAALLLHLTLLIIHAILPGEPSPGLRVASLFTMLVALGRLGFLLLVDVLFNGRSSRPLPKILSDILQGLVYATAAVITLRSAGVEPGSLLTTSALLTAVIGLALQETLGNLVAGLAIQAQRPFEVGDWIQSSADAKTTGRVVEVNWRATRLLTDDVTELMIPNGVLAKNGITNFSRPTGNVRRSVTAQVASAVPPGRVHQAILAALPGVPGVLPEPAPRVLTSGSNYKENYTEYLVQFFVDRFEDREAIDASVRDRVWYAVDRAQFTTPPAGLAEAELRDVERHLRSVDFIKALKEEDLRLLAQRVRKQRFVSGEVILKEGDAGDELFIIRRGKVRIEVRGKEVARLERGQFFGEMSLLTGEKRSATVLAGDDTELLGVGHAAFDEVIRANPAVVDEVSRTVAARQLALEKLKEQDLPHEQAVEQHSSALLARIKNFFSLS